MRAFTERTGETRRMTPAHLKTPDRLRLAQSGAVNAGLHLQRMIGNFALQRLVEAGAEKREAEAAGTAQVMRMPAARIERACGCGGGCPECSAGESAHGQQISRAAPMIARQEASFGEKMSVMWHIGAIDAYRAREIAAESLTAARQTGLPGLHNGPADAWRHCYWNCRMTAVIGKDAAAFVAQNHEDSAEDNPVAERMMDGWNNEEGRNCGEPAPAAGTGADSEDDYAAAAEKIAAQKGPPVDCASCCRQKLDTEQLWTLEDLGNGDWGGKVQHSKPGSHAETPSVEQYEH